MEVTRPIPAPQSRARKERRGGGEIGGEEDLRERCAGVMVDRFGRMERRSIREAAASSRGTEVVLEPAGRLSAGQCVDSDVNVIYP